MSGTLGDQRKAIRWLINDVSIEPVIQTPRLNKVIEQEAFALAREVGYGQVRQVGALTLVAGTFDYDLSTSQQYRNIWELTLASTGFPLEVKSLDVMANLRYAPNGSETQSGDPQFYCITESNDSTVTIRLWPTPDKSDSVDALWGLLPISMNDDDSVIHFNSDMLRTLRYGVASVVVSGAGDAELQKLQLTRNVVGPWIRDRDRGVKAERVRLNRMKRSSYIELTKA